MMKKRVMKCVWGMAMISLFFTGCAKEEGPEQKVEVNETVEEVETTPEVEVNSEKLYEDFLEDEEVLYFAKYNQYEGLDEVAFFEKEKGYTLSEITDILAEHYYEYTEKTEMDSVSYAYLDCGTDGVQELAICFTGLDIYWPNDDSTLVYIIKEKDGRLELCYAYETWARSSASINEYGYFVSTGSGGASNHGTRCGVIDENGDFKFIVSEEEELDILAVNYPEELSKVSSVAAEKSYDGIIAFYTITLKDNMDGGRYVGTLPEDSIYTFEVLDENYEPITEPTMYTDSVYKDIFDEAGVTVLAREEVESKIAEKEKKVGLTEEMRNGQKVEWIVFREKTETAPEEVTDKIVDYGDSITFSCEVKRQPIVWEDAGGMVFSVSTDSVQFQNEFDMLEETTMRKVEEAIGKFPGESFTIWMEGGDGLYGCEYTIQEIVDKPADKVAYGDRVHVTYSMKADGVDRGTDIQIGEQVLHLTYTDKFMASTEIGYSADWAKNRIDNILGKGVGDTFSLSQEGPEWIEYYEYTITGIEKAVEYGDTIKTVVRRASVMAGAEEVVFGQEDISLELQTPKGIITLAGTDLNMADTMKLLKALQGKTIGDRVLFVTMSDSERRVYDISIQNVISGGTGQNKEIAALMMSEKESSVYFYDDNEKAPIYYAIVTDVGSGMVYEYVRDEEGNYWIEMR